MAELFEAGKTRVQHVRLKKIGTVHSFNVLKKKWLVSWDKSKHTLCKHENLAPADPASQKQNKSAVMASESEEEDVPVWEASAVLAGRLFVGALDSALDTPAMLRHGIQLVVSCHDEVMKQASPPSPIRWVRYACNDRADADLLALMDPAADAIHATLAVEGAAALVHCAQGVSRSVALCCAYLMKYQAYTMRAAISRLRAVRPGAAPNRGFWRQLLEFERQCLGGITSFTEAELPGTIMFELEAITAIRNAYRARQVRSREPKAHCGRRSLVPQTTGDERGTCGEQEGSGNVLKTSVSIAAGVVDGAVVADTLRGVGDGLGAPVSPAPTPTPAPVPPMLSQRHVRPHVALGSGSDRKRRRKHRKEQTIKSV